jgi:hypothetical protein
MKISILAALIDRDSQTDERGGNRQTEPNATAPHLYRPQPIAIGLSPGQYLPVADSLRGTSNR